jgi:hypothetical protein
MVEKSSGNHKKIQDDGEENMWIKKRDAAA